MMPPKPQGLSDYQPILDKMQGCDEAMSALQRRHKHGSGVVWTSTKIRSLLNELAQLLPGREQHGYFKPPGYEKHSTPGRNPR